MPNQKIAFMVNSIPSKCSFIPNVYLRTQNAETTIKLAAKGLGIGFVIESGLDEISQNITKNVDFYSLGDDLGDWKIIIASRRNYKFRKFEAFFISLFKQVDKTK